VAARAIGRDYDRASAITELAPHLPADLLANALAAARAIRGAYPCAKALAGMALHLPPEERPAALADALAAALAISDENHRAEALAGLAPHLPPEVLPEALDALLGTCARLPRPQAISRLVGAVAGIGMEQLGGEATVRELVSAIVEVGRRWP
jgi:hypothetical protein